MRRRLIGIIALVLLLGVPVFWIWPPQSAGLTQLEAACWRVGALMAVLWLAYREVERLPRWLVMVIPILLAAVAWRPKLFLVALPLVIALVVLSIKIPTRRQPQESRRATSPSNNTPRQE